jgi:hypothetical protein
MESAQEKIQMQDGNYRLGQMPQRSKWECCCTLECSDSLLQKEQGHNLAESIVMGSVMLVWDLQKRGLNVSVTVLTHNRQQWPAVLMWQ